MISQLIYIWFFTFTMNLVKLKAFFKPNLIYLPNPMCIKQLINLIDPVITIMYVFSLRAHSVITDLSPGTIPSRIASLTYISFHHLEQFLGQSRLTEQGLRACLIETWVEDAWPVVWLDAACAVFGAALVSCLSQASAPRPVAWDAAAGLPGLITRLITCCLIYCYSLY